MQITEENLRDRYRELSTEQLIALQATGTLTGLAEQILTQELDARAISPEERERLATEASEAIDSENAQSERLASLERRLLAQIIDTVIAFAILMLAYSIGHPLAMKTGLLLFLAYLWLADALPRGQSLGKRVTGIAVVDVKTGSPCTIFQSAIRNFLLSLFGFLDWIAIFGRRRQRLGDMAANTIVTRFEPNPARVW
jgi:uncharacterized RDD family membrane protein YckC